MQQNDFLRKYFFSFKDFFSFSWLEKNKLLNDDNAHTFRRKKQGSRFGSFCMSFLVFKNVHENFTKIFSNKLLQNSTYETCDLFFGLKSNM